MWKQFITAMSLKMTLSLANPLNIMGAIKIPEGPNNKRVVGLGQEGICMLAQLPVATHVVLSLGWTQLQGEHHCTSRTWPHVCLTQHCHHTRAAAAVPQLTNGRGTPSNGAVGAQCVCPPPAAPAAVSQLISVPSCTTAVMLLQLLFHPQQLQLAK